MDPRKKILCFLFFVYSINEIYAHAFGNLKELSQFPALTIDPAESIVYAGTNATFICSHPHNLTFLWDFSSKIRSYDITNHVTTFLNPLEPIYYSKLTIYGTTRYMSGEITCSAQGTPLKKVGFLIVNGVRIGGACHNSTDCMTDRAVCNNGTCECPKNYVNLRLSDNGYDLCREMIYSLYDPCELNEQCSVLVDPKSVCNSVCVCAPYTRDRKGRCISLTEISYNRSQEMYRVGLIAVTCIIILIVAMSLWITLKRSCHEQGNSGHHGATQTEANYADVEVVPDKPPAYDDVIICEDIVTAPPNIKDALKHCTTAKKLIRQVSAPPGQLLPQQGPDPKLSYNPKVLSESKEE